jgi:hypothetical protein
VADEIENRVGRVDRRQRVGHTSTLPPPTAGADPPHEVHLRAHSERRRRNAMVQRHEYSIELDAPPEQVWEVFWYRAPDRPQPKDVKTRIEILHPGDADGNGLVRHCYFPVPKWLMSGGVGQSWEWLTEVKPHDSWRYDAVGKPLWSKATGWTKLTDLGDGRTRVTFIEEYTAFNPVMRVLLEKRVHDGLSRDNDTILAALEGGMRWHTKRRARLAKAEAEASEQ